MRGDDPADLLFGKCGQQRHPAGADTERSSVAYRNGEEFDGGIALPSIQTDRFVATPHDQEHRVAGLARQAVEDRTA